MSGTGARFILNTRYFHIAQPGERADGKHSMTQEAASGLMEYLGTRESVSLNLSKEAAQKPPTEKQKDFISQVLKQIPEAKNTFEYRDYKESPTIENASEFISRAAELDEGNMELDDTTAINLMEYIGKRPSAVRVGEHGLFSSSDVDLKKAQQEIAECKGNIWTHVLSIRREDADKLGYDTQQPWKDMVCSKLDMIAREHHIPLEHMHWYAGMHNTGHHPHIHLVVFSDEGCRPHLEKENIRTMKGQFANVIFQDEMLEIYQHKTEYRNEIRAQANLLLNTIMENPQGQFTEEQLASLSEKLVSIHELRAGHTGKSVYRYASPEVKKLTDEFVLELMQSPALKELYRLYGEECLKLEGFYIDNPENIKSILDNEEFKGLKSAVIKAADNLKPLEPNLDESSLADAENSGVSDWIPNGGYGNSYAPFPFDQDDAPPENGEEFSLEKLENMAFLENNEIPEPPAQNADQLDSLIEAEPPEEQPPPDAEPELNQTERRALQLQMREEDVYDEFQKTERGNVFTKLGADYARLGRTAQRNQDEEASRYFSKAQFYYIQGATLGRDAQAAYLLARSHAFGDGVEKDMLQAEKWYGLAAEKGHVNASYELAKMYARGEGMGAEEDPDAAEEYFHRAYEGTLEQLQYFHSKLMAVEEKGDNGNEKEKSRLMSKAAGLEYTLYQMALGGEGTAQDNEAAIGWLKLAEENQHPKAAYTLGQVYEQGKLVPLDYSVAVKHYFTAAQAGNPYANYKLGQFSMEGTGLPKSAENAETFFDAALAGFIASDKKAPSAFLEHRIAQMMERGQGTEADRDAAMEWHRKAADNGDPYSAYRLGVEKDFKEARKWYELAIQNKGGDNAKIGYACLLTYHPEQKGDKEEAFRILSESAANQNGRALCQLGRLYQQGIGTEQDYGKARECYEEAKEVGYKQADDFLQQMHDQLLHSALRSSLRILRFFATGIQSSLDDRMNAGNRNDRKLRNQERRMKEALGYMDDFTM